MFKKLVIHTKRSIKLIILISIAALIVSGIITYFYKPRYSVTLNGELIGYTSNKSKLQTKLNDYIENGDEHNVAYVQIENLPEYKFCFLKRDIKTNDDEIFDIIKNQGTTYYRYYAILNNQEEKFYTSSFSESEEIVKQLKQKDSSNIDAITISEKYETELKDFATVEKAVSDLYVEKQVAVAKKSTGKVNTSYNVSSAKVDLGISLIRPMSGIITSRFAENSRIRSSRHTGLDIAASIGTPIKAAAGGTVSFSGSKGSYGYLIVVNHDNGVQTYYGHCSKLYVPAGTKVSQGQAIAAVGNTGNSTGPHLHFEIRVNGVAYNPQNYLY